MAMERLKNFSNEVTEGRDSFRVEEERVEPCGWIGGRADRIEVCSIWVIVLFIVCVQVKFLASGVFWERSIVVVFGISVTKRTREAHTHTCSLRSGYYTESSSLIFRRCRRISRKCTFRQRQRQLRTIRHSLSKHAVTSLYSFVNWFVWGLPMLVSLHKTIPSFN